MAVQVYDVFKRDSSQCAGSLLHAGGGRNYNARSIPNSEAVTAKPKSESQTPKLQKTNRLIIIYKVRLDSSFCGSGRKNFKFQGSGLRLRTLYF